MDMMSPSNYADEPEPRKGAKIGYASYSRREGRTELDAQLAELECAGCQSTGSEEVQSSSERKVLRRLVRNLKGGDSLTVTKLDRLARSAQEAADIAQALHSKGAALRILNLDTRTATGKHLLQFLTAAADVERTARLDKQHEDKQRMIDLISRDINIRVLALENLARVDELRGEGLTGAQMARQLGLSETVVRHACGELEHRDWVRGEENGELYSNYALEKELSRLRERLAAVMSERG